MRQSETENLGEPPRIGYTAIGRQVWDKRNMATRLPAFVCLTAMVLLLAACSPTGPPAEANYKGPPGPYANETLVGEGGLSFGVGNSHARPGSDTGGGALGVNAYLWRGALDTLSFMPLASADPFGGVIITDWYTPPTVSDERFKATAYILGRELRSDAVRLSIFRQVLQNGQWVDAPVSPVAVGEIENKVLSRARELREQSQASS